MAALIRNLEFYKKSGQFLMQNNFSLIQRKTTVLNNVINTNAMTINRKNYTTKKKSSKYVLIEQRFESLENSLASKGFLRAQIPYKPSDDINNKINELLINFNDIPITIEFPTKTIKYAILNAFSNCFKHWVPNSLLHEINTIDDVIRFYNTSVDTTVPYDALQKMNLPENLHIQKDYLRFHPDTDTMFNGQTAFPKSSTIISGLKCKKKYRGHIVKQSWP